MPETIGPNAPGDTEEGSLALTGTECPGFSSWSPLGCRAAKLWHYLSLKKRMKTMAASSQTGLDFYSEWFAPLLLQGREPFQHALP